MKMSTSCKSWDMSLINQWSKSCWKWRQPDLQCWDPHMSRSSRSTRSRQRAWMKHTQLVSNFAQCSLGQRALNRLQMCSSDPRERTFIIYAIDTTIISTIPVFWVTAEAMKLTAMTQENTVSTTDTILAEFVRRNTAQLGHNIIRTD